MMTFQERMIGFLIAIVAACCVALGVSPTLRAVVETEVLELFHGVILIITFWGSIALVAWVLFCLVRLIWRLFRSVDGWLDRLEENTKLNSDTLASCLDKLNDLEWESRESAKRQEALKVKLETLGNTTPKTAIQAETAIGQVMEQFTAEASHE